jgi:CRISPR-associated protein Cas1
MQLVVNTAGTFITQRDACFRPKQQDRVMDVSPVKAESIVVSKQALLSSQAVVTVLEHNLDVIFHDRCGDPMGRI